MGLADKLPPAGEHFTPQAVEQSAALATALDAADDLNEEYELTGGMPDDVVPVAMALLRARADMPKVGKKDKYDAAGTRYNFRGVDRVVNATRLVLNKHGLLLLPELLDVQRRDVPRASGGRSTETVVRVAFHVVGPRGDVLPVPVVVMGEALDTADKGAAKAMSVAWRVALIQALHIATGDPDPDSMMIERGDGDIDRGEVVVYDPNAYRDEALRKGTSAGRLNQMINDLQRLNRGSELVENENGDEEKLGSMLVRLRKERQANRG